MFQIIGVLPHINIEDESPGVQEGCILIRRRGDLQAATVQHQPGVTGSEDGEGCRFKLCPEIFLTSKLPGHCLEKPGGEAGRAGGSYAVKVETVVVYAACVIAQWGLKMAGETAPYGEKFFQRKLLERRIFLQKLIEVVDICLEMAVVMKVHCLFIDEGLETIVQVWKRSIYERIIVVSVHDKVIPDRAF